MKRQLFLIPILFLNTCAITALTAEHNDFSDYPDSTQKPNSDPPYYNSKILVLNPYRNIEWKTINQYKTNLHAHTTNSDGVFHPHQVVDLYHNAGYSILSITDHNEITYPWTAFSSINTIYENRNPDALGMLAIEGNELSAAHHTGSYLNAVPGSGADMNEAFNTMTQIDGLGAFKHPGRYWNISTQYLPGDQYSIDWYSNYYESYPVIVGMELFNMGDRYPNDRVLWDELLTRMMPDRPVWGHSNDDMHNTNQLFKNYNYMLMPELSPEAFRASMGNGASYFAHEPLGNGDSKLPQIDSIIVDKQKREINVYARNYTSTAWISGVEGAGADRTSRTIAQGIVFDYNGIQTSYVRAVISNEYGMVFTQPFGFAERKPLTIGNIIVERNGCYDNIFLSVEEDYSTDSYSWVLTPDVEFVYRKSDNIIELSPTHFKGLVEVKVFKSNIFGHSDTASVILSVNQRPTTPFIRQNAGVLASDAAEGNQWYNQQGPIQGATDQSFIPASEGEYYAIVSHYGCSSEKSNIIRFNIDHSGVIVKNDPVKIYPNPFSDVITLESFAGSEIIKYELINILGRVVQQGAFNQKVSIRTDHLPMGIYILKFENTGNINARKIIKR